jgi:hypothetical protein
MPQEVFRLSKSRFVAGMQCHKLLWWRVHETNRPNSKALLITTPPLPHDANKFPADAC